MSLHSLALKILREFFSQRCILCCIIFSKFLGNAACPEYWSWWRDTPFPNRRVASVVWMFCTTRILCSFILKNAFVQFSYVKISEAQWRKFWESRLLRYWESFIRAPFWLFSLFYFSLSSLWASWRKHVMWAFMNWAVGVFISPF